MSEIQSSEILNVPETTADQMASLVHHIQGIIIEGYTGDPKNLVFVEYRVGPPRLKYVSEGSVLVVVPHHQYLRLLGDGLPENVTIVVNEHGLVLPIDDENEVRLIVDPHNATLVGGTRHPLVESMRYTVKALVHKPLRGLGLRRIRIPTRAMITQEEHSGRLAQMTGNLLSKRETLVTYGGEGLYIFSVDVVSSDTDPTWLNPITSTVGEVTPTLPELLRALQTARLQPVMAYPAVGVELPLVGRRLEGAVRVFEAIGLWIKTFPRHTVEEIIYAFSMEPVLAADQVVRPGERMALHGITPSELDSLSRSDTEFIARFRGTHQRLIFVCSAIAGPFIVGAE